MKFVMGYEKDMSFLVIPKSPKVWEKYEKIGLGSFKFYCKLQIKTTWWTYEVFYVVWPKFGWNLAKNV